MRESGVERSVEAGTLAWRRQRHVARLVRDAGLPRGNGLGDLNEELQTMKIRRQLPMLLLLPLLLVLLLVVVVVMAVIVVIVVMTTTRATMIMTRFVGATKEQHRGNAHAAPEPREPMAPVRHRWLRASQTMGLYVFTTTGMFTSP